MYGVRIGPSRSLALSLSRIALSLSRIALSLSHSLALALSLSRSLASLSRSLALSLSRTLALSLSRSLAHSCSILPLKICSSYLYRLTTQLLNWVVLSTLTITSQCFSRPLLKHLAHGTRREDWVPFVWPSGNIHSWMATCVWGSSLFCVLSL